MISISKLSRQSFGEGGSTLNDQPSVFRPSSSFLHTSLVVLLVPAFFAPTATAGERSVTDAEATGTYRDAKGSSEIRILALEHGKLKVQLALVYEYQSGE